MKNCARSREKVRLMRFSVECEDVTNRNKKRAFYGEKRQDPSLFFFSSLMSPALRCSMTAVAVGGAFVTLNIKTKQAHCICHYYAMLKAL